MKSRRERVAYQREWARNNVERVRENNRRAKKAFLLRHPEYEKKRRLKNIEAHRAYDRRYTKRRFRRLRKMGLTSRGTPYKSGWEIRRIHIEKMQSITSEQKKLGIIRSRKTNKKRFSDMTPEQRSEYMRPAREVLKKKRELIRKVKQILGKNYKKILSQ